MSCFSHLDRAFFCRKSREFAKLKIFQTDFFSSEAPCPSSHVDSIMCPHSPQSHGVDGFRSHRMRSVRPVADPEDRDGGAKGVWDAVDTIPD